MIATLELTETECRTAVDQYLANALGTAYRAGRGELRNGGWVFIVTNQRADMTRVPVVGSIVVDALSGQIQKLTYDQIRNMREAGAVQAAQARNELARNVDGYVLRRHAWIKASRWLSDHVGMKIGAEDGQFLDQESPIWRFSIICYLHSLETNLFGAIDVDASTGQVIPLTETQIQTIQEAVSAAIRYQKQTATR
ncbi:MAG: hypothetical protein R3C14_27440 [Caldilineaceae bacterium]